MSFDGSQIIEMKIRVPTVLRIIDYLINRPQFVRIGANVKSKTKYTNTDAHQGTVLPQFLLSLYTADCRGQHQNTPVVKFADDIGLTGLITDDDDYHYQQQICSCCGLV